MTEREMLIDLIVSADISLFGSDKPYAEVYADYLLANGVIVPPYKVGTKVYIAYEEHINRVFDGALVSYSLDAAHLWFNCHYTCGLNMWHPIEDFGKHVFLTKEDAEKALKERSEGK